MVKNGEKKEAARPADAETEEKRRLRALAIAKKLLRRTPSRPSAPLEPSKAALKLEGRDIVKRGQRKSRYLFSFPGLLAPLSGGRVGDLADLATKNPVLYLDFPQGRMKLFGTHVYPKNKYLSLQLSKSSKGVVCEDSFESLIVFSEAWWIGRKEENPEELQLEFPKDLNEEKQADYDFKGGAGASVEEIQCSNKPRKDHIEPPSPETEMEDDMLEDSHLSTRKHLENTVEATPTRHSARNAGKKFRYAESSSGSDSIASDAEGSEEMDNQVDVKNHNAIKSSLFEETEGSSLAAETMSVDAKSKSLGNIQQTTLSIKKSEENPPHKKGTLVQATLSTLFDKVAEKTSKRKANETPETEGFISKRPRASSKQITDQVQAKKSNKKVAQTVVKKTGAKKAGAKKAGWPMQSQAQCADTAEIEDISSESQDESDEDWAM